MTEYHGPEDLVETAYPDYIEVASKSTGGKVEFFRCPHCRAIFDGFPDVQLGLDSCVAHARECASRPKTVL